MTEQEIRYSPVHAHKILSSDGLESRLQSLGRLTGVVWQGTQSLDGSLIVKPSVSGETADKETQKNDN